jgi:phytoene desaturase
VAVIGGGFGGLAAAIRLQASGARVTVIERRERVGGRAYVYRDAGFTFDAGPTVVTAPECLEDLFAAGGRALSDYVELMPVEPLYRLCWEDGYRFDYTADLSETLAQIGRKSPRDVDGYKRFLAYAEAVFEEGYTKLAHVPFLDWGSMIRVAPQLLRLSAYRSVYGMVSRYLTDPQLCQAFSFHSLLVGGNPFRASAIYTLIHALERKWGVYFPRGGTSALVDGLARYFTDLGGTIRTSERVQRIATENGRVTGVVAGRQFEPFDAVISNADVARTYLDLLREEPRVKRERNRLARASYSMSLFVVYFGTRRRFPGIAHHNVIFGARYRELLDDIFRRGVVADDFSLYLHAPTVSDPSLAPPGGEAFYALSPVPHLGKAPIDWQREAPRYADRILRYLEARYLPGLRESIVTQRYFTPQDFHDQLEAHHGSAFSLEPLLTQSAYFRVHNRDPKVAGLYFVGAGTHPGAGIPGVINSAKATAGVMLADWRKPAAIEVPRISAALPVASDSEVLAHCREMIRVGSKSFRLASTLFSPRTRDAACFLYGWCRYCDDQIDQAVAAPEQRARLDALVTATRHALAGDPPQRPEFIALSALARRYAIPELYAVELLEGMGMDVRRERYPGLSELSLYCYRVAGTVGLMMSHVMGVSDPRALRHAADLGTAMQMTNIARDVLEDAAMGRVYLPLEWLRRAGIDPDAVGEPRYRAQLARVVARLLAEADRHYRSGNAGLRYLPFRCACAVAAASCVYAEIGRRVLRRGERAWDTRTVVPAWRKILALGKGVALALATVPARALRPWRRVELLPIWRHA